jgi:hypothetical protein
MSTIAFRYFPCSALVVCLLGSFPDIATAQGILRNGDIVTGSVSGSGVETWNFSETAAPAGPGVHRQLMPPADRKIRRPFRTVEPQVSGTILDQRSAPFFGLDPPGHDVVIAWRRLPFPIEEVSLAIRQGR